MGHGGFGVSVSNGGKLPPRKFLGNSTTSRGHSGGANVKGHSGGAGSRGRSESAKLDRTSGEGELGGTSGDEGELSGTGWGADSASSWDGAALERTLRAPGTERVLERTVRAPGTERALERTLRAPGTERVLNEVQVW